MRSALLILPIMSGVMWGAAGVFVRELSAFGMDGVTIVFTRVAVATLMMLALILSMDRRFLRIDPRDLWVVVLCALTMLGLNVFYTVSVDTLSLSLAAVLLSLSPLFMLVLARVIFRESITSKKLVCMVASVAGCVLVSGLLEGGSSLSAVGVMAGLAAAFCYAMYGIASKKAASMGYRTYTILFYSLLISTIITAPFSDFGVVADFASGGVADMGFMILHSAVASFLPYILYTTAMVRTEAGTTSLLAACGEPVAAAVFGLLVFSEVPTPLMLVGMVVAIGSMAVMCMPSPKTDRGPCARRTCACFRRLSQGACPYPPEAR